MKVKVKWDTTDDEHPDGQDAGLPEVIDIPDDVSKEYERDLIKEGGWSGIIDDYLSDTYGWCTLGWSEV